MDIWRAIYKGAADQNWSPINNKLYLERRYATSAMKYGRNSMSYDRQEEMWVSSDGRMVYRVVKVTVEDDQWENVPPKK